MKQYLYADGVENVTLAGGMVRLDLFHFAGRPEHGQQEMPREVDQQLVLPPAAFMRAFESMQRFVAELEKSGVVKRQPSPVENASKGRDAVSPNFE
ncbi:MAG: hypothetical protein IJB31_06295 [Akkermansia sp.]|nr:hypothetical protein [Akkermansia sp.]